MEGSQRAHVRELIELALRTLPRMRLADGVFCLEVNTDMKPRGRSIRYSVIAALGLLRATANDYCVPLELQGLVDGLLRLGEDPSLTPGDLGLLLWLNQRAGGNRLPHIASQLSHRLERPDCLSTLDGMEVAWIVIGTH
jgi:hypothetical protein